MYNIRSKNYSNKQKIMEPVQSIKTNQATKDTVIIYNNKKTSTSNSPKHRIKRPKNAPRTLKNYNEWYRTANEALKNNFFVDNLRNTFYVVLTVKDKHIKSVNLVRKWVMDYTKSFNLHKVFVIAMIELNEEHHPHVHMLMTTCERSQQQLITQEDIRSHWKYGIIKSVYHPNAKYANDPKAYYKEYLSRLLNYSIKTFRGVKEYSMVFDKERALKYKRIKARLENHEEYLMKRRDNQVTLIGKKLFNKKIGVTHNILHKVNNLRKRELQKQYTVKDHPLYIRYGKNKPLRNDSPTLKDVEAITKSKNFFEGRKTEIRDVNTETGEIQSKMTTYTEWFW